MENRFFASFFGVQYLEILKNRAAHIHLHHLIFVTFCIRVTLLSVSYIRCLSLKSCFCELLFCGFFLTWYLCCGRINLMKFTSKMQGKNMTRIYLIRHGQSIGNAKRMYLGHTDLDLTPLGYRQAEATAKKLSDVPFSAVYSSDLLRAFHTAEPHAKMRGLEVTPTEKLREIFIGKWENVPLDELMQNELFVKGWRGDFGNFTFPGGECVADAAERVYAEIKRIAEAHKGESVAVVFHAAAIRAFWCKMLGLPKDEWASKVDFSTNASYSIAEYENGEFFPVAYSCNEHIEAMENMP